MTATKQVLSARPRLAQRARAAQLERRRGRLRRAAQVLAITAPFLLAGWLLLASPWFVLSKVVVVGEQRLTATQVLVAAGVRTGTPLARVDTTAVAARIRALGPVASVSVTRDWPDTLRVRVVERVPVAGVSSAGGWLLLDAGGAVIGPSATLPPDVVKLVVTRPTASDPGTAAALTVLRGLPQAVRAAVATLQAPTAEQVSFVLRDGRQVVWGGVVDGSAKTAALVALLRMPGHLYDVSSPGVVTRS